MVLMSIINKKSKTALLLFIFLSLILTQPACWDKKEVERLGIVMGIGVEPAPEGRVRVTVHQVIPSTLAKGGGGGGGAPLGVTSKPYRNKSIEGDTILAAIRELSQESSRELFFAHNQVILMSEELARERGIKEVLDFFERSPKIRRTNWLLVGKGDLATLLDVPSRIGTSPALRIKGTIDEQHMTSQYAAQKLGDFLELMESESTHPFTAGVEVITNPAFPKEQNQDLISGHVPEPQEDIKLNGTAVFRKDKLAGWLNSRESRGLLWVRGEVKGGVIEVNNPDGEGKPVSLDTLSAKSRLQPELKDGQVFMNAEIKVDSNLTETAGPLDLTKPETIRQLEALLAEAIKAEIESALIKAQREYRVDVFGFGEAVHREYPGEWKEMKESWPELFPSVPVQAQVEAKIRRTGLVSRPVEPKQR